LIDFIGLFDTICSMTEQAQEEALSLIKEVEANPAITQRAVSKKLGISLGKTNYLIKELITKGLIKGESFSNNPGKLKKISYLLTPKGFEEKLRLTYHFLWKKKSEYDQIKREWEQISSGGNGQKVYDEEAKK